VEFGADGIVFSVGRVHASNNFISPETARKIVDVLPPFCASVLVTHLADGNEIVDLAKVTNVKTVQLDGDSTPEHVFVIRQQLQCAWESNRRSDVRS
jgi:phosphoribosylanthranilate isomerase